MRDAEVALLAHLLTTFDMVEDGAQCSTAGWCAILCAGIAVNRTRKPPHNGSEGRLGLRWAAQWCGRLMVMQAGRPQRLPWRGRKSERGRVPPRCDGDAQILSRKVLVRVVVVHGAVKWRLCRGVARWFRELVLASSPGWAGLVKARSNKPRDARTHRIEDGIPNTAGQLCKM